MALFNNEIVFIPVCDPDSFSIWDKFFCVRRFAIVDIGINICCEVLLYQILEITQPIISEELQAVKYLSKYYDQ